jgi:hypothetical protein
MSLLSERTRKGLTEAILVPAGIGVVVLLLLVLNGWIGSVA